MKFDSRTATDARVDAPDTALRQHFLVGFVVVVAVEDDLWESTSEYKQRVDGVGA